MPIGFMAAHADVQDAVDPGSDALAEQVRVFEEQIQPLLSEYCVHCHNVDEMTSGIRVDHLQGDIQEQHLFLWKDILKQLSREAMPPEDEPQPTGEQRQMMVDWIRQAMEAARHRLAQNNGSARRLTVAQYRNTLHDLLLINDEITDTLPPDAISKDGFVNNEETMLLTPLLVESYLEIAREALELCVVDERSKPAIQSFRMDLGAAVNPEPYPDPLILGAFSVLLANQDFMVTETEPIKPFEFVPRRMQTKFEFIEGYQGNDTVRGWRSYDSIYHAVFACMRGNNGYPLGEAYELVPEGLLLRQAIPSAEIFRRESTYGPRANFKIALRELPERGNFRVTVRAAKYDDALLLEPEVQPMAEPTEGAITIRNPAEPKTIDIDQAGIYQADVHVEMADAESLPSPDASRLAEGLIGEWSLDGDVNSTGAEPKLVGRTIGGATFVESPFGQAVSLDGGSGFALVPREDALNVGEGEFTVTAWIRPRELRQSGIVCLGKYGYTHGWLVDMPTDKGVLRIETANANGEHNGTAESRTGVLRVGHWQHVAVVVRRGENQTRLYVNGYEVGTGTVNAANLDNPSMDMHIGRIPGSQLFAGEIDEVRIYRRALEAAELVALVAPGKEFADPPPAEGPARLTVTLGGRQFTAIRSEPAFLCTRLPAGPLSVSTNYRGEQPLDRIVLTPLAENHPVAKRFTKFEQRSPRVGVHVGLRRDCGSALTQVGDVHAVSSTELGTYVFQGAISNYPSPDVEKDNVNYLAGVREIAVRSEYTDGRERPRLLIRSIEFEGPYYESWPSASHRNIFIDSENIDDPAVYAREVIRHFATRAFRRPVTAAEEEALWAVWKESFDAKGDFQESIKDALQVVLSSPQFLFVVERSETPEPEPLAPYELASKLSYFLWNSPPDQQLLDLASADQLHDELKAEVDRMIADPRFERFIDQFAAQWLSLDKFDVVELDHQRYPRMTRDTKKALRQEPVHFLRYLIQNNLPVRNLIQSEFIMANEVVASYYDLGSRTEKGFEFTAVQHESKQLGGVLAQASILAGLSDGRESNPVKRGAWLARKMIAEPPDDPPPNVPELEEDTSHLSLRERLRLHREQPGCAKCHEGIDPWGLPFEQLDAGGRWKTDASVDAHAKLPDGTEVSGFNELRYYLAGERIDQVAFSFTKHLAAYAIGRSLTYHEIELLREKLLQLKPDEYPMRDLVQFVIHDELFLRK